MSSRKINIIPLNLEYYDHIPAANDFAAQMRQIYYYTKQYVAVGKSICSYSHMDVANYTDRIMFVLYYVNDKTDTKTYKKILIHYYPKYGRVTTPKHKKINSTPRYISPTSMS